MKMGVHFCASRYRLSARRGTNGWLFRLGSTHLWCLMISNSSLDAVGFQCACSNSSEPFDCKASTCSPSALTNCPAYFVVHCTNRPCIPGPLSLLARARWPIFYVPMGLLRILLPRQDLSTPLLCGILPSLKPLRGI